jgi:hypothetical protein
LIGTARHDLPIGMTLTHAKEPIMKMHLVMTAAFVGLCSHAAFAASEGGDTWSAVQSIADSRSTQSAVAATDAASSDLQRGFPVAASEGGDTWSALQSLTDGNAGQTTVAAINAQSSSPEQGFPMTASEGGDTWSAVQSLGVVPATYVNLATRIGK